MSIWNLFSELRGRPAARRNLRRPGLAGRSCRPVLEVLEDRCLLSYSVTDLGTLGGSTSAAAGINAAGQVVGTSNTYGNSAYRAFRYDATATPPMADLGTLGGMHSQAWGINASGQVVGYAYTATPFIYHAFLYDATATPAMQDLGTLGGTLSFAHGINDSGQVVGQAATAGDGASHAFLYDATATPPMLDLGTLGGMDSFAYGINASGQAVGSAHLAGDVVSHAFLYDGTATPAMQDLGTLGGSNSEAFGINASSQVVGYAMVVGDGASHAFLYDGTATPATVDLGTLGGTSSVANGINALGQVVGYATVAGDAANHAFLYDGTAMQDLNGQIPSDSGWVLNEARGINDNGQIVGYGVINGQTHAFLLTPDPGRGAVRPPLLAAVPPPFSASSVVSAGFNHTADATSNQGAEFGRNDHFKMDCIALAHTQLCCGITHDGLVGAATGNFVPSPTEQEPIPAPGPQAIQRTDPGVTPATASLALEVTVTPVQRKSHTHASPVGMDGPDKVFSGMRDDLPLALRLARS
jgi:probable HAF family extracellular repeat protein